MESYIHKDSQMGENNDNPTISNKNQQRLWSKVYAKASYGSVKVSDIFRFFTFLCYKM